MTISDNDLPPADEPEAASGGDHMADQAARLGTVRAPEIEDEGGPAPDDLRQLDEDGREVEVEPDMMDRAAFKALFRHVWNIPGMMVGYLKPLGITPEKSDACDECAEATFDLAEMHFPGLLRNDNATAAAIIRMLPFVLMQAGAFRAIMADRQAERRAQAAQAQRQPANTNAAPEFKSSRAPEGGAGRFDYLDEERQAA